jgi:hypothetical protein
MGLRVRILLKWAAVIALSFVAGWAAKPDPHWPPERGKLGLPANCSAYVDASIAGYRLKQYTADEAFAGLERNCGAGGALWRDR